MTQKKTVALVLLIFISLGSIGQSSVKLGWQEMQKTTSLPQLQRVGIKYPPRVSYRCHDKAGEWYIVLAESADSISATDTCSHILQGAFIRPEGDSLRLLYFWHDFTINNPNSEEYSIWFWSRYCTIEDIDKDGYLDPIIIYGSAGMNYTGDGRIKIMVKHGARSVSFIRHQNGTLDYDRKTTVDNAFYLLPSAITQRVKGIMTQIQKDKNAIFPYGWQQAMDKHKTYFDEMPFLNDLKGR
ncbi:MAG: hypothetical protein JSS76_05240 [Bacteroidetes bacterium]|nr:hypothetical protein [Bacteroidota bacterium]